MRYTRYDYKRYEKLKFLLSVIVIIAVSIGGGFWAGNIIFNKSIIFPQSVKTQEKADSLDNLDLVALQCGYYGKEENAKKCLSQVKNYCVGFIVDDNGKYRIIAGIYKESDVQKNIDELKKNGIETSKIKFNLNSSNEEEAKLIEIENGAVAIMNKLQENDVESVKSSEFKKWVNDIIGNSKDIKNEKLKSMYESINNLPEEMTKNNTQEFYGNIYEIINEK